MGPMPRKTDRCFLTYIKVSVANSRAMSTSPHTCKGRKRIAVKPTLLALAIAGFLSGQIVEAGDNNPFDGYSAYANSYFLDYVNGTSFAPGGTSDVQVSVTIDGTSHTFNVDTGSRGLYASSTELGPHFADPQNLPGTYPGQIQLTSSHRYNSGYWVPTTLSFAVKDQNGVSKTVTSSVNILDVTTLSAQAGYTATYGVDIAPTLHLAAIWYVASAGCLRRRWPYVHRVAELIEMLEPWNLVPVYAIATVVAVVKLDMMGTVDWKAGALWILVLSLCSLCAAEAFDRELVEERLEALK